MFFFSIIICDSLFNFLYIVSLILYTRVQRYVCLYNCLWELKCLMARKDCCTKWVASSACVLSLSLYFHLSHTFPRIPPFMFHHYHWSNPPSQQNIIIDFLLLFCLQLCLSKSTSKHLFEFVAAGEISLYIQKWRQDRNIVKRCSGEGNGNIGVLLLDWLKNRLRTCNRIWLHCWSTQYHDCAIWISQFSIKQIGSPVITIIAIRSLRRYFIQFLTLRAYVIHVRWI